MLYQGHRTQIPEICRWYKAVEFLGPVLSADGARALSGDFNTFENKYRQLDQSWQHIQGITTFTDTATYEPGKTHISHWVRSLDDADLRKSHLHTVYYRENYIGLSGLNVAANVPTTWGAVEWHVVIDGLALDYILFGDEHSRTALAKLAYHVALTQAVGTFANWSNNSFTFSSGRTFVNALKALTACVYLGIEVSDIYNQYGRMPGTARSNLDLLIGYIAALQNADGGIRFTNPDHNGHCQAFQMGGYLAFYLSHCNHLIFDNSNTTITNIIKGLHECCHLWIIDRGADQHSFDPTDGHIVYPAGTDQSFYYMDGGNLYGDPGLGGFFYPVSYYLWHLTGDPLYKRRGDQILHAEMTIAPFFFRKEFYQQYFAGQIGLGYRELTPLATPTVPTSLSDPTISVIGNQVTVAHGGWGNVPSSYAIDIYRQTHFATSAGHQPIVASISGASPTSLIYNSSGNAGYRLFGVARAANGAGNSLQVRSNDTGIMSA